MSGGVRSGICACGAAGARFGYCQACMRKYHHAKKEPCPSCGKPKEPRARECVPCYKARRAGVPIANLNPFCPNKEPCELRQPHKHCDCGIPINPQGGWCELCWRELKRGAAMNDRQSAKYEEAA